MNRDLVFFIAGLCFGIIAGYFVFRAVVPPATPAAVESRAPSEGTSQIGLDSEPDVAVLDEDEAARLEAEAAKSPNDAEARVRLGGLYMDAGRYGDAVKWLDEAVALAPRDLHVRNHLALAYLNMGRLDDAIATYEATLRFEPDHPASLLGLGRVKLYLQQDIDGGLAMWERLLDVAPSSAEAESIRDEVEALKSAHPGN